MPDVASVAFTVTVLFSADTVLMTGAVASYFTISFTISDVADGYYVLYALANIVVDAVSVLHVNASV